MKKVIYNIVFIIFTFIIFPVVSYASGTVAFSMTSPTSFYVGDTLNVAFNLSTIDGYDDDDYLSFLSGTLTYDEDKLEYISSTPDVSGLTVVKNPGGNISIGINTSETLLDHSMRLVVLRFEGLEEVTSTGLSYTVTGSKAGSNVNLLTANTPTLNVAVEAEKSTNNDIRSLIVKDNSNKILDLVPEFDSNTLSYELDVPYSTTFLKLTPVLDDINASYKIVGSLVLVAGQEQLITINVTSESGSNKAYIIQAFRENQISEDASLKTLSISNYSNFVFDPNRTTYTLVYNSEEDLEDFDVDYETTDENSTVTINKPKKLVNGSKVVITVTAQDETTTTDYTLKIKIASTKTTAAIAKSNSNKTITIGKILIGAIVLIAIAIIVLLIYLKKSGKPKIDKNSKEDLEKTKIYDKEAPKKDIEDTDEYLNEEDNEDKEEETHDEDSDDDNDEDEPTRIFD